MKDRSKIISSLLVSLMAGFIYYQLSDKPVMQSIKSVLSDKIGHEEIAPSAEPFRSLISKESNNKKSNSGKYYIKKKKIKPIELIAENVSELELISEFVSRQVASAQRPLPDIEGYLASKFESDENKTGFIFKTFASNIVKPSELNTEEDELNLSLGSIYGGENISGLSDNSGLVKTAIVKRERSREKEKIHNYNYDYNYNYNYDYNYNYSYNYNYDCDKKNKRKTETKKAPKDVKRKSIEGKFDCELNIPEINVIIPEVNVNVKMKKMKFQVPDAKNNMIDVEIEIPETDIEIK